MLPFTPLPRLRDFCLGVVFLMTTSGVYAVNYALFLHKSDDPYTQRLYLSTIGFGYVQNFLGFIAGLWLARITAQQAMMVTPPEPLSEEEMLLVVGEEADTCPSV